MSKGESHFWPGRFLRSRQAEGTEDPDAVGADVRAEHGFVPIDEVADSAAGPEALLIAHQEGLNREHKSLTDTPDHSTSVGI